MKVSGATIYSLFRATIGESAHWRQPLNFPLQSGSILCLSSYLHPHPGLSCRGLFARKSALQAFPRPTVTSRISYRPTAHGMAVPPLI